MGTPAARHCCSSAISPRSAASNIFDTMLTSSGIEESFLFKGRSLSVFSLATSHSLGHCRELSSSWCSTTKENGTSKMPAAASTATMSARKPSIAHHY